MGSEVISMSWLLWIIAALILKFLQVTLALVQLLTRVFLTHELQHAKLHYLCFLLEFAQTHVHWVSDAIQPSHLLLPTSPPVLNLSQHQGLFKCQFFTSGGQSIGVSASASVLPVSIQDWFPLGWLVRYSCNPRYSQESSLTPQFQKHPLFGAQLSL